MNTKEACSIISGILTKYSSYIKLAFLFGSRAENRAGALSDYDIGVVFEKKTDLLELVPRLVVDLAQALKVKEDLIDIVILDPAKVPIELVYKAAWRGIPLYYRSREDLVEFKARVLSMFLDYKLLIQKHKLVEKFYIRLKNRRENE